MALVWTYAPGPVFGNAYMNDLNLVVTAGASTYLGNHMVLGVSQTGGTADTRNNAEAVFLPAGTSGALRVRPRLSSPAGCTRGTGLRVPSRWKPPPLSVRR